MSVGARRGGPGALPVGSLLKGKGWRSPGWPSPCCVERKQWWGEDCNGSRGLGEPRRGKYQLEGMFHWQLRGALLKDKGGRFSPFEASAALEGGASTPQRSKEREAPSQPLL